MAIISNGARPYRIALHHGGSRGEMAEVELWSLFTHQVSNAASAYEPPAGIRAVLFGEGEQSSLQARPSRALHEWRRGTDYPLAGESIGSRRCLLEGIAIFGQIADFAVVRTGKRRSGVALGRRSNIRGDRRRGISGWIKRMVVSRILTAMCGGGLGLRDRRAGSISPSMG